MTANLSLGGFANQLKEGRDLFQKKILIKSLGMPKNTLGGWISKAKKGEIDTGNGNGNPEEALNLAQELQEERRKNKALEKRIKELEELNEFLEEASAFFAASRQKYAKRKE